MEAEHVYISAPLLSYTVQMRGLRTKNKFPPPNHWFCLNIECGPPHYQKIYNSYIFKTFILPVVNGVEEGSLSYSCYTIIR